MSTPIARKPATSAEIRSLSLTRSSPAPVTCSSPPAAASAASAGSSSIRPGTSLGRDARAVGGRVPHADACRAVRPPPRASTSAVDVGAGTRQDVEQRRSWRGSGPRSTISRSDPGRAAAATSPESGRRNIARDGLARPGARWPPRDRDGSRRRRSTGRQTRRGPTPYDLVWGPARDRCHALGLKPGQQDRALDLRARHVGREVDRRQGRAVHRHRGAAVGRLEPGAHPRRAAR